MQQYWYVIKNQKYFGPYGMAEIESLHLENKLDHDAVIWHPKWPAPKLNFKTNLTPPPLTIRTNSTETIKDGFYPFDKKKNYQPLNTLKSLTRNIQHQKNYKYMTTKIFPLTTAFNPLLKYLKIDPRLTMFIAIISTCWIMFSVINHTPLPNRPESMAPSQYKKFEDFWNTPSTTSESDSKYFFTMMSKDYKTLWLAAHENLMIESITLQADSKNILSKNNFNKSWDYPPNEKLVPLTFDNLDLPTMGFYQLKIMWIESAPWSFDTTKKSISIDLIIGHQNHEQLQVLVKQFHEPRSSEHHFSVDSLQAELKEKYHTLSSLVVDIKNNWNEIKELSHAKMAKAMNSFQISYAKSTGSFLSALVLNNEKEIKNLSQGKKTVDTTLIAHLHNLTENAKKTGVLSADLMSNYLIYAKNPKKDALWTKKISLLEKDLLDKLSQL